MCLHFVAQKLCQMGPPNTTIILNQLQKKIIIIIKNLNQKRSWGGVKFFVKIENDDHG